MADITVRISDTRDGGVDIKFDPHPLQLRDRLKLDPSSETTAEFMFSRMVSTLHTIIKNYDKEMSKPKSSLHLL